MKTGITATAAVLFGILICFSGCKRKTLSNLAKQSNKPQYIGYFIHQPSSTSPNMKVNIWKSPARNKGGVAFKLSHNTKVKILKSVEGDKYHYKGCLYKIETSDGRVGWVPDRWCRRKKKGEVK